MKRHRFAEIATPANEWPARERCVFCGLLRRCLWTLSPKSVPNRMQFLYATPLRGKRSVGMWSTEAPQCAVRAVAA